MGLAGPKVKQRIGADPQNKRWRENKSSVGFKLMEKMGWSEGVGLGADGKGMVDNIAVKLKENNRGIGAEKNTGDNWLENSFAFDSLLASLNTNPKQEKEEGKKEATPPALSGRLYHRQKFIRNKRVSNYDDSRLKEILGQKTEVTKPDSSNTQSISEDSKETSTEKKPPVLSDNIMIVKNVSVQDYFKQKMAMLKSGGTSSQNTTDTVEETPVSKGEASPTVNSDSTEMDIPKKEKKKSKKRKAPEEDDSVEPSKKEKKKSKKDKSVKKKDKKKDKEKKSK